MFTIFAYKNRADKRKLDKTNDLTNVNSYVNCVLKDDTSLNTPIFKIKETNAQNILDINYIYVDELQTYYFVNDIVYLNNGIIEIHCKNDVLMSNKEDIKKLRGVVSRQENRYNLYLNDERYKTYNYTATQTYLFSDGLTSENYVLAVAGVTS